MMITFKQQDGETPEDTITLVASRIIGWYSQESGNDDHPVCHIMVEGIDFDHAVAHSVNEVKGMYRDAMLERERELRRIQYQAMWENPRPTAAQRHGAMREIMGGFEPGSELR